MGVLSSVFGSSTKSLEPSWQTKARKSLTKYAQPGAVERIQRAGETYGGNLVAGLSDTEQLSLEQLNALLASPSVSESSLFKAASDELTKTLSGDYDPVSGQYYQAYRNAVMNELQESKDRLASRTSASDQFFGGGRIETEGELEEDAMGSLAQELGRLFEAERTNRLGAASTAAGLAMASQESDLQRIEAGQTLGALPRQLEQAEYDAEYQEWLRSLNDLGISLDTYVGMTTYQPPMAVGSSPISQLGNLAGSVFSAAGSAGGFGKLFS